MEQTKYTVFYTSGFLTDGDCECHALEDYLSEKVVGSTPPVAWAPVGYWEWTRDNPGRDCDDLRAESIAAGRVIELVGNSYVARGTEEKTKGALFRIGGVYRQRRGDLVLLDSVLRDGDWQGEMLTGRYKGARSGGYKPETGRYCFARVNSPHEADLLPGELVNRDGKWISVFESAAIDAGGCGVGISKTPTLDKLERSSSCSKRPSDDNAAMIARDGPAKERQCICGHHWTRGIVHRLDGPCYMEEVVSTAKPSLPALTRCTDTNVSQLGVWGSAYLFGRE